MHSGAVCAGSNPAGGAGHSDFTNAQANCPALCMQNCDQWKREQDQNRPPHTPPKTALRAEMRRPAAAGHPSKRTVCACRRYNADTLRAQRQDARRTLPASAAACRR
jgi:hypothetical protein